MNPSLSLDPRTLVVSNLILSVSILILLLVARVGLGRASRRLTGWMLGDCVLLISRLIYPVSWCIGAAEVQTTLLRCMLPMIISGVLVHVLALRSARGITIDIGTVATALLFTAPGWLAVELASGEHCIDIFLGSLIIGWLWMAREALPLSARSAGGRGLTFVALLVATLDTAMLTTQHGRLSSMLNTAGLLIDMLVMLASSSCFLLWMQEELRRDLSAVAITDALTGVLNRHGLMPHLEQKLAAAHVTGRPLSIVLCDLDHFKAVNDIYGHAAGDQVLQRFAQGARAMLRLEDRFGRWGGEEFLFVLPDTARAEALSIVERLRKAGPAVRHDPASRAPSVVTFSAGVASSFEDQEQVDVERLLARADRRLYLAKTRRDCAVASDEAPISIEMKTLTAGT